MKSSSFCLKPFKCLDFASHISLWVCYVYVIKPEIVWNHRNTEQMERTENIQLIMKGLRQKEGRKYERERERKGGRVRVKSKIRKTASNTMIDDRV